MGEKLIYGTAEASTKQPREKAAEKRGTYTCSALVRSYRQGVARCPVVLWLLEKNMKIFCMDIFLT